jgi:hypothetical protein
MEWPLGAAHSSARDLGDQAALDRYVRSVSGGQPWAWPRKRICFLADPHADAAAFSASLALAGMIEPGGHADGSLFQLSQQGSTTEFIIGGDCLDKGPSNLGLLRALKGLIDTGAELTLLAGNHDLRLLMGLRFLDHERDVFHEHMFIRMGAKVVPLLREVFEQSVAGGDVLGTLPDEASCRERLYPRPAWAQRFAAAAADMLTPAAINRELIRMQSKFDSFESVCRESGLGMREVYAAALVCRDLFLQPGGEFHWFTRQMQLLTRRGALLFVHAGVDDGLLARLEERSVDMLNADFRRQLEHTPFAVYHGVLGNALRTKYRNVDRPLTSNGLSAARRLGLHAVVHGHRNRTTGQRLALRGGLLHVESDVTLDRNSRRQEGLNGVGAGVTVVEPDGAILGVSRDFPAIKRFAPNSCLAKLQKQTHAA